VAELPAILLVIEIFLAISDASAFNQRSLLGVAMLNFTAEPCLLG